MASRAARSLQLLLGAVIALAALVLFSSMCGANTHLPGSLLGSLGGILAGLYRRLPRLRWLATGAGGAGGMTGSLLEHLGTGSCAGLPDALGAGILTGLGLGMAADALRRRPPHPEQRGM